MRKMNKERLSNVQAEQKKGVASVKREDEKIEGKGLTFEVNL